jgi:hypothetical protein
MGGATKPEALSDPIMQRSSVFSSLSTIASNIGGANGTRVAQIDKISAKSTPSRAKQKTP